METKAYVIVRTAAREDRDLDVFIQGPGMMAGGSPYVLATMARCRAMVDAMNVAFENGFAAGFEYAKTHSQRTDKCQ
jgi:hypothetical protein